MSTNEHSVRDKLGPTISYLQKLGPDLLPEIFDTARWLFATDPDMAFEVIPDPSSIYLPLDSCIGLHF